MQALLKMATIFLILMLGIPTVIQLKYMAEPLGVNIRIGGLWHAGSYDPQDSLGRLIGAKSWVRHAESSMFACYDDNYFATDFHIDMFVDAFSKGQTIRRVGWSWSILRTVWICIRTWKNEI